MKPFRNLASTRTPDGSQFMLHEHDGEFFLKLNGRQLMSTTSTTSELLLAELPCKHLGDVKQPCVLIGGLGLGYSLKRVLQLVPKDSVVKVAELLPEVVAWNREYLRAVNGKLLDDRRVEVIEEDVFAVIRKAGPAAFDVILLDVDNGPTSFVQAENARLYGRRGFGLIRTALKPEGRVAFWSACEERGFVQSLARAGFQAEAFPCKAHERAKRLAHVIYVAQRREDPAPLCEAPGRVPGPRGRTAKPVPGSPDSRRSRR